MTRPLRKRAEKPRSLETFYNYKAERREIEQAVAALRAEPPSSERDALLAAYDAPQDGPSYVRRNGHEWISLSNRIAYAYAHGEWEKLERELATEDDIRLAEQPPESASHPDKDKRRQRILDTSRVLSHQTQAVDLLRAGLTFAEIADELGITRGSLKRLFNRIKAKTLTARSSPSPSGE